jgi:peptide/nickel transport system substrate-binding protein
MEDPIKLHTNNDYLDIITYVARQWEILGIKIEIVLMESALLRSGMRSGDIELFRASWIADYPDEENFLSLFYSKNGAPPNYTRFSNKAFDELYEKSLNENDDKLRLQLYQSMNRIIIEQCPVVFLFYDETALFYNKRINDPSINGINLLNVKQISID